VPERRGYRVKTISRCDEHHLGQVKGQLYVMVPELLVLLGIKHLEHCAGRVSPVVAGQLVYLVKKNQGIFRPRLGEGVYNPSRHRADIGLSVSPYVGLVLDSAKRYPYIFSSKSRS